MIAADQRPFHRTVGQVLGSVRVAVAGPVIVVALVLALLITLRLETYHGNPAGFVLFGQRYVQYTHPPAGAPIESPVGYDGQFYWIHATDPLLLHRSTVTDIHGAGRGYRLQRPAYPALAFLLAAGQRNALPWALLVVNVLAVLGITAAFAVYARGRGWSPWWALAIGLLPGLLMPTLRDLTDTLAISTMLGGLLAWHSGRRWLAGGLLAVAALSREPMTLAVVAIAVDAAGGWWRSRGEPGALRRAVLRAGPAVVIPTVAFVGWQVYIHFRVGGMAGATGPPVGFFSGFINEVRMMLSGAPTTVAIWDTVYVALMLAGLVAAVGLAIRGTMAAGVASLLFAATLTLIVFGDQWGDTRYSAPLFAVLLLGGLEQRFRPAVIVSVAAASMSIFLPWVITGL